MGTRVLAGEVAAKVGEKIELDGWVHRIRDLAEVTFVILRDRSGMVQLVLDKAAAKEADLTLESVVRINGEAALNPKAPGGAEVKVEHLDLLSCAINELPFQVNGDISKVGIEAILDNRLLSLRNPKINAVFKVQATLIKAFGDFLRSQDFTEIKTSKLVSGGTEGGTELFKVEYFDKTVCLAQSPQFYKETMVASGMERVFEIAPAYRAEKHDTPRHLNEYISLDVEMGFIESEKDLIEIEKGFLRHAFEELKRTNEAEVALWASNGGSIPDPSIVDKAPTISYEDAVKIANDASLKNKGGRIFDINPEAERYVCEWSDVENGSPLVFVNEFPRRYRPFYTYPSGQTGTMSFDALFRGLEITTGGRRQHNYQAFVETLPRFGLKEEDFASTYVPLLKYGCPPHGGFAIGLERLTARILGLPNVKEASLFPRDRKRVSP
jgi:nondiscriminating aspartyl-tRNA synthetase